jgi:hypothetical protein
LQSWLQAQMAERFPVSAHLSAMSDASDTREDAILSANHNLLQRILGKRPSGQEAKQRLVEKEISKALETEDWAELSQLQFRNDLVCATGGVWYGIAEFQTAQFIQTLEAQYEEYARPFRTDIRRALAAKTLSEYSSAWNKSLEAKRAVTRLGTFVMLLKIAHEERTYSISEIISVNPFSRFVDDMRMWEQTLAKRSPWLNQNPIQVQADGQGMELMTPVRNLLESKGAILANSKGAVELHVQGTSECLNASPIIRQWQCAVSVVLDLQSGKQSIGRKTLENEQWAVFARGDQAEACAQACGESLQKAAQSSTLNNAIVEIVRSHLPIDL